MMGRSRTDQKGVYRSMRERDLSMCSCLYVYLCVIYYLGRGSMTRWFPESSSSSCGESDGRTLPTAS